MSLSLTQGIGKFIICFCFVWFLTGVADAASLQINPSTAVYGSGQTFSVRVIVNTAGQKINAAEGTVTFNPSQLSVVSVSKGSMFTLWTAEPSFSNVQGTISFSGGNPTGYTGEAGTILTITFRATGSGSARVSLRDGSVLAADGRGTNILTSMQAGTFTITSQSITPEPERIIEYVPPANTPSAPTVTSSSHTDESVWYKTNSATLSWSVPAGVTGVRTLLSDSPSAVPTKVYDTPISSLVLDDLPNGTSYFHIQFRNAEGWGKVTTFRLNVDTEAPTDFTLALPEGADFSNPQQTLTYTVTETVSSVKRFIIQIDGGAGIEYLVPPESGNTIVLPTLTPGYHSIIVEAFDSAGNSAIDAISVTITAFEKPTFTEFPDQIGPTVIPVFRGQTRPLSQVEVTLARLGASALGVSDREVYTVASDESGQFTFIPANRLAVGVYEISAVARASDGAQSEISDPRRLVVTEPGVVRLGIYALNVLSVVVPLIAMLILLIFLLFFSVSRLRLFRRGVARESAEALAILQREFSSLHQQLYEDEQAIIQERKSGKLTKNEADLLAHLKAALVASEQKVKKEVQDVKRLTE